jgi:hypothetical protein
MYSTENSTRHWTPWITHRSGYRLKTDNQKYIKIKWGGFEAKASCHPVDEFNLERGTVICIAKIMKMAVME